MKSFSILFWLTLTDVSCYHTMKPIVNISSGLSKFREILLAPGPPWRDDMGEVTRLNFGFYSHQHWKTWRNCRSLMDTLDIEHHSVPLYFHEDWGRNFSFPHGGRVAWPFSIWEMGILVLTSIFFFSLLPVSWTPEHQPFSSLWKDPNPHLSQITYFGWFDTTLLCFQLGFLAFIFFCVIYSVPPPN